MIGSVIAPPLVVYIEMHFGWRAAFLLPNLLGLIWILPWLRTYRTEARSTGSPALGGGEVTVCDLLRPRQAWGVILMRSFTGPLTQFYWYWLPLYLVRGRGLSMSTMAAMASFAYLLGGFGQLGGGYFSGLLIRRGMTVDKSRKLCFLLGGGIAVLCTFLVPVVSSARNANLLAGLGIFGINGMSNMVIAVITDVFPQDTLARVTGMTGVGEGVMNMILSLATGIIVDRFSFLPVFVGGAIMPVAAIVALYALVGECRLMTAEEIAPTR